ncbi:MAG: FG-GAP-like repeat-containing protein [Gammaproteobacteria bacterium]
MFISRQNKQLTAALLFTIVISAIFWSQSRIPALNEKAQMGLRTNFGELAFEIILPVTQEQALLERVIKSSINWAYTNLVGMLFGLLFAAAILTVLGTIKSRSFKRPWLNTLSGIFLGAPLGVCVNCATPIAFGIFSAGARLETALATLFSSPTLNVIVLTMSFTLLPWEMALAKLFGVLLLLISIPFLVNKFSNISDSKNLKNIAARKFTKELTNCSIQTQTNVDESFIEAMFVTVRSFIKHTIYVVKFALPLMLLAGFLGAFVLELVPFDIFSSVNASILSFVVCALVAMILPVPIAFDIIIVMALLANGADKGLATIILFGLGIYSIYPAFLIARYISIRLSLAIAVTVIIISCGLGFASQIYFDFKANKEQIEITRGLAQSSKNIYKEAINICERLPEQLQSICFEQHIGQFNEIVPYNTMCTTRPSGLEINICKNKVHAFITKEKALKNRNEKLCMDLSKTNSNFQCIYYVTVQSAIKDHDIGICNKLSDSEAISFCRNEYLNANLLFNPDGSACKSLTDNEFRDCHINAAVYRYTDSMDIDGCDEIEIEGAREHCRYTVASAMIGRHNDSSGCLKLHSQTARERCKSLTTAWQARRDMSQDLCRKLKFKDIRNTCLLRIADKKIRKLLVKQTLLTSADILENMPAAQNQIDIQLNPLPIVPRKEWKKVYSNNQIEITFTPYSKQDSANSKSFQKLSGKELGITKSWDFRMTDFFEPFIIGKGIASGDFNNDLWPDIALATERGILIYQNIGGRFELVPVNQGDMQYANLFLVAFVDINNDGMQDIFASSYSGKNYLLINVNGSFKQAKLQTLDDNHRLTISAGFGDLNQDGELDIVLGNWSSGVEKLFAPEFSGNNILFRDGDSYRKEKIDEINGETNSILLADINGDNLTDLLIGNDRLVPDMYYLNQGQGNFESISIDSGLVPTTTMFTMSIDAADFNNDLEPDLFGTDMTFTRSGREDYCSSIEDSDTRNRCKDILSAYQEFQEGSAISCIQRSNVLERHECFIAFSVKAAKELKNPQFCESLPNKNSAVYSLCEYLASPVPSEESIDQKLFLPQVQRNTLLIRDGDRFIEKAEEFGVASSYWSWNAKAADLDNDGWQDIYVGNGFHFGDNFYEIQENIMFRNINGHRFEQVQTKWGLNDSVNTPSYTYLDLDLDGDLDIITTGVLSPPSVYLNHLEKKNSIMFSLIDEQGNSFGIGSKITIRYGGEKHLHQRKENKLSGGFMSFNNPVVHFGLNQETVIDELEIQWPDGSITFYNKPLPASGIYRIHRLAISN